MADRDISRSNLEALCDALGLEFYIGPKRDTGKVQSVMMNAGDHETLEYAHIPLHETLLAAGAGADQGEEVIDRIAFRRDWLTKIGVAPSSARLARVKGDSMEPTLIEGDMVLIDTSAAEPRVFKREQRDRRHSQIFAFADGSGARVKRIERPEPDQIMLLSDNTQYLPELVHGSDLADLKIIGRVVWWGHTVKE